MPSVGLLLDILLLGALGAAMYRLWLLSRQFEQVRAERDAFEHLISALNIAAGRAQDAIEGLKAAATESGDGLQSKVNAARALEAELEIMLQAGDSLAERLQAAAAQARAGTPPSGTPIAEAMPPAPAAPPKETPPRTRAEKELMDALRARQDG